MVSEILKNNNREKRFSLVQNTVLYPPRPEQRSRICELVRRTEDSPVSSRIVMCILEFCHTPLESAFVSSEERTYLKTICYFEMPLLDYLQP